MAKMADLLGNRRERRDSITTSAQVQELTGSENLSTYSVCTRHKHNIRYWTASEKNVTSTNEFIASIHEQISDETLAEHRVHPSLHGATQTDTGAQRRTIKHLPPTLHNHG